MRFLVVVSIALAFQSCSKNKAEERRAEQPTEVSGGFGLTMECSVLNKSDENVSSSAIGCLVFNDDGSPYKGKISEPKAEVIAKNSQIISVDKIALGSESGGGYSFVAELPSMKPYDAASVKFTAKFDGVLETLTARMGRAAQVCDKDVTYYVRHKSENLTYPNNIMCTKDAPCSQISKAIDLIPEFVDCKITIDVGPGTYEGEDGKIWLTKPKVVFGGKILIKGQLGEDKKPSTIIKTGGSQWIRLYELSGTKIITQDDVTIEGVKIVCSDPRHTGTTIMGTNAAFRNFEIENCLYGVRSIRDSRIAIDSVRINNPTNSGIHLTSSTLFGSGDVAIIGGPNSPSGSAGLRLDDNSVFLANSRIDWLVSKPYFKLDIRGLHDGIILNNNSMMYLHEGDSVSIGDVSEGIYAFAGSSVYFRRHPLAKPLKDRFDPAPPAKQPSQAEQVVIADLDRYLRENPAKISIKDFKISGVRLGRDALFSDGDIYTFDLGLDSSKEYDCNSKPPESYDDFYTIEKVEVPASDGKCRYITKKPIIELHDKYISSSAVDPLPVSMFMRSDASTLALRFSSLELCGSRLSKVGQGGEYAFGAANGGLMILAWDQSPFFMGCGTGEVKSADLVGKHVMTFSELFYPQSSLTGQEGLCPLNYVKSGDFCYGRLGYFYHHPLRHPNLIAYLGVLPGESRVDSLPALPIVSSVTVTPPAVIAAGNTVTINGQWFMKDATVTVGGVPCLDPVVNEAGSNISCKLPILAGPTSARPIQVTNPITGKNSNINVTVTY